MLSKKLLLYAGALAMLLLLAAMTGCSDSDNLIQNPETAVTQNEDAGDNNPPEFDEIITHCIELPTTLPSGITIVDIKKSLAARNNIAFEMLAPEVLAELNSSYDPEEYYIDSIGLHWGKPKYPISDVALGSCYRPYGFSIVNWHFVYWFHYRPSSYDAYMAWVKIYAQPYGSNGILVQKRDICWICSCNPWCAQLWLRICAK